jgi:hypothetical protein
LSDGQTYFWQVQANSVSDGSSLYSDCFRFSLGTVAPPAIVSFSPNSGTGLSAVFNAVISDPEGMADLNQVWLLVDKTKSGGGACFVDYQPQLNLLKLRNDSGGAWMLPGLTPGGSGTQSNSQCTLNASTSSAIVSGNQVTLQISVTFASGLPGPLNVYLSASGMSGLTSGLVKVGTWTP